MAIGFDLLFFFCGWLIGQMLFNGYEAHLPLRKRLGKLLILTILFVAVHTLLGRQFFYGLLACMTIGMAILHGYWFHFRHGIDWRTAEPKEKYLRLIGKEA